MLLICQYLYPHSAGADDHIDCVEKLHKVSRNTTKVCMTISIVYCGNVVTYTIKVNRNHLREIADLTASLHLSTVPVPNVCCVHR